MIRVHILYEYTGDLIHGASTIRLLLPLSHPKLAKSIIVSSGKIYEGIDADIIIVDRLWKPKIKLSDAENLVEYTRKKRITLIYSLDDNLLDLNINEPGNIFPSPQERNIIRYFIRESDGILVSTYALYERIKNLNERIIVVENALDERVIDEITRNIFTEKFNLKHKNKDKLIIGYMGTRTHVRDLMAIFPAIKKISQKYNNNLRFEILGVLSNDNISKLLPNALIQVDVKEHSEYTKFWRWMNEHIFWDIAIAPLENNEFTKCKSDIKFLDYSALGIPGIYSRHVPYESTVIHGKTGLLVENDTESWVIALEQLIEDVNLRRTLGINAKDYVFSNRILDKCAFNWEKALLMFYSTEKTSIRSNV